MGTNVKAILASIILAGSMGIAELTAAQSYPTKPVRLIMGQGAGGATDIVTRVFANKLSEVWGQQVIVDNRPGAGNTIGTAIAAKAAPDGYTLHLCAISDAIAPALYKSLPFEFARDIAAISLFGTTPNVLLVHPSVPARSVQEFISYVKANPGKLNYGSNGMGATPHLSMEWLKALTGMNIIHVPYKGIFTPALIGGEVLAAITNLPGVLPNIRTGKIRALGVTSAKRSKYLPEIPTIVEAGVNGFEVVVWYGICAPAGVPKTIVSKINVDMVKMLGTADLQARLDQQGVEASSSSVEQFSAFIRSETAKWAKVVKDAGVQPQ
jgi:tripartite-type tricarboxylate transporter receptor subunit TctC